MIENVTGELEGDEEEEAEVAEVLFAATEDMDGDDEAQHDETDAHHNLENDVLQISDSSSDASQHLCFDRSFYLEAFFRGLQCYPIVADI